MTLQRARLVFVTALVLAVVVLFTEFPIADLTHARSSVASASVELSKVQRENDALRLQVRDLKQGSTVEEIAHDEYGLVEPGQQSVVVMPSNASASADRKSSAGGEEAEAPLGATTIPESDIVPSDAALAQVSGASTSSGDSFWHRVLDRLEFWKASV